MDWTEAVEVNMTKDWKCGEALHLAPLVTRPEKETRQKQSKHNCCAASNNNICVRSTNKN